MADNTQINKNQTPGDKIATDEISGIKHQRVKVQYGADGTAVDVSSQFPFPITGTGPSADAFSRFRVTNPKTIFEVQHQYNTQPFVWNDTVVGGSSSITHLPNESSVLLTIGTGATDRILRNTKENIRYQPGKSQLLMLTGILGAKKTNVIQSLGIYDDNDGVFFLQDENFLRVVVRSSTSGSPVDTSVIQSSWNLDKLDGTGPSGITLNTSNVQIFVIDSQWLGAGRVRFGFNINGRLIYCHQIDHANIATTVYTKTLNLPVQYEIRNTATSTSVTTMKQICASVVSEGGFESEGIPYSTNNNATGVSVTTRRPILSIRRAATFNGITNTGRIVPNNFGALSTVQNILLELVHINGSGGGLVGASWSAVDTNSIVEVDVAATDMTGDVHTIASTYVPASAIGGGLPGFREEIISKLPLGSNESLSLVATSLVTSTNVYGTLNWREIY